MILYFLINIMPDINSVEDKPPRMPSVLNVAVYSLLFNLGLVAAKFILSFLAGSLALRADAVHSLVDVLASLALILGLKISERKSKSFPLGLYKVENLASIAISFLLFGTAYEIISEALRSDAPMVQYHEYILLAVAVLIPLPYLFGSYQIRVGNESGSPSLIADGIQHKADVLTSSLVFLALIAQAFAMPLDRLAAGVIAIVIVKEGWDILVSGMRVLLDASVDAKTLEKIRSLIIEAPEVSTLGEVVARNSGRYLFVEAGLTFRIADLNRAHQACRRIEAKIRQEIPHVDRVLIHYEPQAKTSLVYVVPLGDRLGTIGEHFGESPYFALLEIDLAKKELLRQEIIANSCKDLSKGRGLKLARFLLSYKPDAILSKEDLSGKGPGYAFAEAGVETRVIDAGALDELVRDLLAWDVLA